MSFSATSAIVELMDRRIQKQRSRAAAASYTNPRGRRDTAEDDSSAAIIGSLTAVDASSCLESTEVTYTPPTPDP
ncbi:hypothetical protein ASD54_08670 [Rhizobium sp. Root149]|jgi:hypothetical protein|uniref:hypothetical protein n=1 Tax=Rhizobium sp. Root149 TaxID=1736473 RepID=UPI000712A9A8|nr:hypothetical protein [Rhizobium sp. Root149]KQZ50318.1 hypothetical protein ASD54_08670 [Rhizobium sp. Root149]